MDNNNYWFSLLCYYRLLGPERTRDNRAFYQSAQPLTSAVSADSSTIISALGDITNQLCHVQASISSLDSKVEDLSEKTTKLTKRVASMEEATEQQPAKKRKVHIPLELSVSSIIIDNCSDFFVCLDYHKTSL